MAQQHDLTEWDEDVTASTEDEYAALLRAIRWAQGFSPAVCTVLYRQKGSG
jgi:hypothetical protein